MVDICRTTVEPIKSRKGVPAEENGTDWCGFALGENERPWDHPSACPTLWRPWRNRGRVTLAEAQKKRASMAKTPARWVWRKQWTSGINWSGHVRASCYSSICYRVCVPSSQDNYTTWCALTGNRPEKKSMKAWKKSAALFSHRVVRGNIDQIISNYLSWLLYVYCYER